MTQELLPCPFCGGNDIRLKEKGDIRFYRCFSCRCAAPSNNENPEIAWNTRAMPKMQKVDLDVEVNTLSNSVLFNDGWNRAIAYIKSKYGELYAEVK